MRFGDGWEASRWITAGNSPTDIFPVDWHTRVASFKFPQCVSPSSVPILGLVSRKTHSFAGTHDVALPLTGGGIEDRSGGPNGNHELVVTFSVPVTFSGATTSCGSVMGTSTSGNQVTIDLTAVPNASRCSVTLNDVTNGTSTPGAANLPVNFLVGDTNADSFVDSADIAQTKSQSGQAVTDSNLREDVNVDGLIDSADIAFVKSKSGSALP